MGDSDPLEAAQKANIEKRKQLEAEKAQKRKEIEEKYLMAWKCLGAAIRAINTLKFLKNNRLTSNTWTDSEKLPSVERFYTGYHCFGPKHFRHCYKIKVHDTGAEVYLLQQKQKYEPLVESLRRQKENL